MRILSLFFIPLLLLACQPDDERSRSKPRGPSRQAALQGPPRPPEPPIFETFDGAPQLSLFARLGDYRPESDDSIALPFWQTYLEHLLKTSGVVPVDGSGNRAFALRAIKGLDSVGFFSPLAVTADTSYEVRFLARTTLPDGGTAGIGILEFDEFLWVGEQYPQSLDDQHRRGEQAGVTLDGTNDWTAQTFRFTTGPDTGMIHLILFRDGTPSREPVFFDDIEIQRITSQ